MKLAHVFTLVVGLHLVVIAALFVAPGCTNEPSQPAVVAADPVGMPARAQEQPAASSSRAPAGASSSGSGVTRYPPTRPSWNLNETTEPEVIVAAEPEPVRRAPQSPSSVYVAEELEVIEPSQETMSSFNTAPSSSPSPRYSTPTPSTRYSTPTPSAPRPTVPGRTYIVKKGDTLGAIARRNGVSLNELMAANGYTRDTAHRLSIGEKLTIPAVDDEPEAPAAAPSPQFQSAEIDQAGVRYVVQSGDNLSRIASRHGSTVAAIKSANRLTSDRIFVDQELLIPEVERAPEPTPGVPDAEGRVVYEVKPGDTLGAIARRYDVAVKEIMRANNISDPRRLRVNQKLVIPTDLNPVDAAPSAPSPRVTPAPAAPSPAPAAPPAPSPAPAAPEEVDLETIDLDSIEPVDVEDAR